MSPSVALNPVLLKNPNPNSGRKHTFHFTPIVPKRKLSIDSDLSNSDNGHTSNLPNKRHNRSNSVAASDQTTVNPVATIKISRKWVLPPRPKPGRKTLLNGSNTPNSTSSTTSKRRTQSVPAGPPVNSGPHNNNNNILNKTNLSKQNSSNYLAFLKFDNITSCSNKPFVDDDTIGEQDSILSTTPTQNENTTPPFTSNNFSIVKSPGENSTKTRTTTTTTSVTSAISTTSSTSTAFQRESSLSHTAITAPTSDLCLSLNKLRSFTFNNDNIDTISDNNNIPKELDLACDQDIPSAMLSSFASNASSCDIMMGPANCDEFIEKTTNDELENEIYNNIWNFLSRYNNNPIDYGAVSIDDGDKYNYDVVSSEKDNASTDAVVNDVGVYFYSAPSLEELMDKQNKDSSNLRNLGLALQD